MNWGYGKYKVDNVDLISLFNQVILFLRLLYLNTVAYNIVHHISNGTVNMIEVIKTFYEKQYQFLVHCKED